MGVKRRSALWLLALAAIAVPRAAASAPRRIAVLNAATDDDAGARAALRLRRALREAPELSPLPPGGLSDALEKSLPVESQADRKLRLARAQLDEARTAIAHFDQAPARRALGRAEALLLTVEPDERVVQLLAEISFHAGLVHLRDQNLGLAVDAFRLVLRLMPERAPLDPARYPPEVIQAFAAARKPLGTPGGLDVRSTFNASVYLDGVRVGATPLDIEIAPGPHYLLLSDPEYKAAGRRLDVVPRERTSLNVELERLPMEERASEIRRRLASARGARVNTLSRAASDVALMVGVDAVLVVGDGPGMPAVAVYDRNWDRLSVFRPVDKEVGKLFGLLLPAPAPMPIDLLPDFKVEEPSPWYLRPWAVGALSGGTILAILGVVLLSSEPIETDRTTGHWVGFGD